MSPTTEILANNREWTIVFDQPVSIIRSCRFVQVQALISTVYPTVLNFAHYNYVPGVTLYYIGIHLVFSLYYMGLKPGLSYHSLGDQLRASIYEYTTVVLRCRPLMQHLLH